MTANTPSRTGRIETSVIVLMFCAALAVNGWAVHVGWHIDLLQGNEFRQSQTALTALFVQRDHDFSLAYPTPVLGKPWSIPMEFPLYQWTVAAYSTATGTPLIQSGRAVSYGCFLLSLPAVWLLLGQLRLCASQRLIVLCVLLTCPLYIFYARAFLIETMALMFGLWFLQAFLVAVRQRSVPWAIVANLAGIAAGLVKVTTFMLFLIPAGVCSAVWLWKAFRSAHGSPAARVGPLLGWILTVTIVPFGAAYWWIHFSDAVKALNPSGAQLMSASLSSYNFGTWSLRMTAAPWVSHWKTITTNVASVPALLVSGMAFAAAPSPWRKWIAAGVVLFASGPLIFPVLYSWHEYYFVANTAFLMIAMGLAVASWFDASRPRWLAWPLVGALLGLQLWLYGSSFYPLQRIVHYGGSGLTQLLRDMTDPNDVIVIAGNDWTSAIPFYAERRALMLRRGFESDGSYVPRAFQDLKGESVTVLLLVADQRGNEELVKKAERMFGIDPQPLLTHLDQTLYVSRARRAEFVRRTENVYYDDVKFINPAERVPTVGPRKSAENTMRFFAAMSPKPYQYQVPFALSFRSLRNGDLVFDAHAPTRLWFRVPTRAHRVEAEFGLLEDAYTREGPRSDGIDVSIVLRGSDGTEEKVYTRTLDPLTRPDDGGPQRLEFELPQAPFAELIFQIGPGPNGSNAFDWAYVRRLEIK